MVNNLNIKKKQQEKHHYDQMQMMAKIKKNVPSLDKDNKFSLKYLIIGNLWRSLDLPLINCKVKLDL